DLLGRPLPNQITSRALTDFLGRDQDPAPGDAPPSLIARPPAATAAATADGRMAPPRGHGRGRTTEVAAPAPTPTRHGVLVPLEVPPGTSGFQSRPGTL